jgi:hypothetical protein
MFDRTHFMQMCALHWEATASHALDVML